MIIIRYIPITIRYIPITIQYYTDYYSVYAYTEFNLVYSD